MENKHTSHICHRRTGRLKKVIQRNRLLVRRTYPVHTYSPRLLFPGLPLAAMQACVIVPAKNEGANIIQTLRALHGQLDRNGQPLSPESYEILLLANNCTDNTCEVATAYARQHPELQLHIAQVTLQKEEAHIGTARRLLMDEAFRRHGLNGRDGIILSTDADTEADACWIANTMHEISCGYDVVGGRILAREVNADSKLYYLQDTAYRCLAAKLEAMTDSGEGGVKGTHFQCFGASLAVRCSTYQKAGRLPVIPFLEDEAFSRALYRVDARVKKSSAVKVYTSSRLAGRVEAGLSVHLRHLAGMHQHKVAFEVESFATLLEKFTIKKHLRECWRLRKEDRWHEAKACLHTAASVMQVSPQWLMAEMDLSLYFGAFWEKAEQQMYAGEWSKRQHKVLIGKAIEDLRCYVKYID